MATEKGDMQSVGLCGWFTTDPDHAAEADVKKDVVYGNSVYTGIYDPGGAHNIILEDVGIQLR